MNVKDGSRSTLRLIAKLFATLTFFTGCQDGDDQSLVPQLKPVSGIITHNGQPLQGVVVSFLPTAEGGTLSVGQTGNDGKYKLSYLGMQGCTPGQYQVMLSYKTTPEGKVVSLEMQSALIMPKEASQAIERMPKEYSPGNKTLKATVPAEGGEISFEIKGELLPLEESIKPTEK